MTTGNKVQFSYVKNISLAQIPLKMAHPSFIYANLIKLYLHHAPELTPSRKEPRNKGYDFFHRPSQKSPIPAADLRFEEGLDATSLARPTKKPGYVVRGKAKALYNFVAQNPR